MNAFYNDVLQGLNATPKYLQSKYFYDAEGDKLFQQIMAAPEYYPTKCEQEIFAEQTNALADAITEKMEEFDIVELGAGDATKSTFLLQHLAQTGRRFAYYPIDISANVIKLLELEMPQRIPGLRIKGLQGDYFEMIKQSYVVSQRPKVVLFLGSNIGNFLPQEAKRFLRTVHQHLKKGDLLLIGFDLKKNPAQIRAAYNDAAGVTRAFNMNLLTRINRELGADFDLQAFEHYPSYDPISGAARSFLISLKKQQVCIGDTEVISFEANEPIYVELSQKYSVAETDEMAASAGFQPIHYFFDSNRWFLDVLWQRN